MTAVQFFGMILFIFLLGCKEQSAPTGSGNVKPGSMDNDSSRINGTPCDITFNGVHFTKSVNGADTLASVDTNGKITFRVGGKKDYFNDPDSNLSNNTAPILLSKVNNTKPFTLVAKVSPGFKEQGLYNAAVLYVYVNDGFWQKHCYEQDERGKHRIVTVRTQGTSDDNNHDVVTTPYIYLKIASNGKTIASYYSYNKKEWQLVRLYKNNYPKEIWMGISAQCPIDTGTVSYFEELTLTQQGVEDIRMGN